MALILIVDDSPTEVFVMQKALEKHGFKTAAAENGEEGIRKAKAMKPDLIFMDIVMPGVNGYQATRMLNNDPETSSDPHHHGDHQGSGNRSGLGFAPRGRGLSREARVRSGVGREGAGRAGRMTSTMSGSENSLRSLRDRPFELLKELEKRSRTVAAGARSGCRRRARMGGGGFPHGRRDLSRGPRGDPRGAGLSCSDHPHSRREELGEGARQRARAAAADAGSAAVSRQRRDHARSATRVWWWSIIGRFRPASSSMKYWDSGVSPSRNSTPKRRRRSIRCDVYLAGAFRRGGEVWPVLSLKSLVESQSFLQAAS